MKYILFIVIICAAIVAFILLRKKKPSLPVDVYVCSECGLKDCNCHKETVQDPKTR